MYLQDSLSGERVAIPSDFVSIYACGITPYSAAHIGHARTYVIFDLMAKTLRASGRTVQLVRNITDIDDKILATAAAEGIKWDALAARNSAENRRLMIATGLSVPVEPKASDYLEEIFSIIAQLLDKGLAYVAPTGDVLYRVSAYTGQVLMAHKAGSLKSAAGQSRVSTEGKDDARDFALWKMVPADAVGFHSPWGYGRPGWHIECSAMIGALFGGSVTIHGGGTDLKFPHHQAEIMQSEPVFGKPLATAWAHNGSVLSDGVKMSKSLGNVVGWAEALDAANALAPGLGDDVLRVALLSAHWQKPLDWKPRLLHDAYSLLLKLTKQFATPANYSPSDTREFLGNSLNLNLNTPAALNWMVAHTKGNQPDKVAAGLSMLGVNIQGWREHHKTLTPTLDLSDAQKTLVAQLQRDRAQARSSKNWPLADSLRDQLRALGVTENDTAA